MQTKKGSNVYDGQSSNSCLIIFKCYLYLQIWNTFDFVSSFIFVFLNEIAHVNYL